MGFFTAVWDRRPGGTRPRIHARSRVPIPAAVEAPAATLRALRELDDHLDLYVFRDGRTWLLQWQESKWREREGQKEIEQARKDGGEIDAMVSARLRAAGFAFLGEFTPAEANSVGFMERTAARKLYATNADVRAAMRQARHVANSDAQAEERAAVIMERVRSMGKSDHAWAFKGRKSFSSRTS